MSSPRSLWLSCVASGSAVVSEGTAVGASENLVKLHKLEREETLRIGAYW